MSEVGAVKGRAVVQERLRGLAVSYAVARQLQGLADDEWREISRTEHQVGMMLKLLGAPLGDGPFSIEAAERALAQLDDGEGSDET